MTSNTFSLSGDGDDAIEVEGLVAHYPPGPPVLKIESLCIRSGESVFLHGPSGSGKTTLLSVISGVLQPQSGSVRVLSHELTKMSAAARDTLRGSQIGYIFQGFNLIPYLSVAENIALPCLVHPQRKGRIFAPTLNEEIIRLALRLDIHAHLHSSVTRLSVGQQQRVAIARAIIGSPAILIADEPTSSLDTDRREAFLDLLTDVTAEARSHGVNTTLLFVSHDLSLAPRFDRTVSLGQLNQQSRRCEP